MTILKSGEAQIQAVQEPMEIFQLVQNLPKGMIDAGALMESCFRRRNGIGHLTQKELESKRSRISGMRTKQLSKRMSKDDLSVTKDTRDGPRSYARLRKISARGK